IAVERQAPLDRRDDQIDVVDAGGAHATFHVRGRGSLPSPPVQLFHYHLVTSKVREVEARYLGKLGFDLVARYGRIGEETTSFEQGTSWEHLDRMGFKLRLAELERGAVNVVVQPGQWGLPRVDHIGLALDEDEFFDAVSEAQRRELRIQEHGGRRTFVATGVGYRLELHPPRDWIEELLGERDELRLAELHLLADEPETKAGARAGLLGLATGVGYRLERHPPPDWIEELLGERDELRLAELHLLADEPETKAGALAGLLGLEADRGSVEVGDTVIRFLPGGPQGRPELHGE